MAGARPLPFSPPGPAAPLLLDLARERYVTATPEEIGETTESIAALRPGRGRTAVPVRSAIFGATLGVAALTLPAAADPRVGVTSATTGGPTGKPPAQAERMRDALVAAGVPCDLRFFEANFHGVMPLEIVIDTKKSDLLPMANICCTTAPFSRLPRTT